MKAQDDEKLVGNLCKQIQARIHSGKYPPGFKLRQEVLAAEFQVSRTPIREALSQLAAKGVIDYQPQTGAVVKRHSSRDVHEIYRVRAEVEGLAAELASEWITDAQLMLLQNVHRRFVSAIGTLNKYRIGQPGANHEETDAIHRAREDWINSNAEFHSIIYHASNNACLQRVIADLHMSYTRNVLISSALGMYKYRMEQTTVHHQEILSALERRDPQAARLAMARHIIESGEFVVAWLDNQTRD